MDDADLFGEAMSTVEDKIEFETPPSDFFYPETDDLIKYPLDDGFELTEISVPTPKSRQDSVVKEGSTGSSILQDTEQPVPEARIEVAISEVPLELRNEYVEVYSNVVERITTSSVTSGQLQYDVEFTDGRNETLPFNLVLELENGKNALHRFQNEFNLSMHPATRKRKTRPDDEWGSNSDDVASDHMELDEDDEEIETQSTSTTVKRSFRSWESSNRPRLSVRNSASELDDEEILLARPARNLRTRKPQQMKITNMGFNTSFDDRDQDELALGAREISEDDGDFLPITSDIMLKKGRPSRAVQRSRRLQMQRSRSKRQRGGSRKESQDSDIEFEQPRRSARTTRNMSNMNDNSLLDDDSFSVVDDKALAIPKVISVREVFQPISPESDFGSVHMQQCHSCNGSKQRGQLLYCQGCSLAYHRNCIGIRSAREHLVTKIGEDDFLFQCRFCINIYKKKDVNAPAQSMCQNCKENGRACAAFSVRKTSRQEEKLRVENGGVDPITEVPSDLVNKSENVMFRCTSCHRGWHQEHLPSTSPDSVATDLKTDRLKDYSVDWQCNDCSSTMCKIHRLVAWRPVTQQDGRPDYKDISEDNREYLVKWMDKSYASCAWMPGAWVFGAASGATRIAFGKRAVQQDLLKYSESEAIPVEYLMPDIILNVKMEGSYTKAKSKAGDLANISRVAKIFVKFQGLGYDDVVWTSPPEEDNPELYGAFVEAYREYVEGKHFRSEPYSKIRDRIKTYKNSPFIEVENQPDGLKRGKLMGYQIEGLNWLLQNFHQGRSVVLADEMGLGKTVQVVSLVTSLVQDSPRCWPFLIVVPNATCPNWRREFKQWAPDIRVVAYHGGKEPQDLAYNYELFPNGSSEMKAQAVIMSYDSAQDPRTATLFKSVHWMGLVVDEGQRLKNDQNLLYNALRSMKIPFRLLLTGTPLQNNKRELFNLLQFIDDTQNAVALDAEYEVLDKHTLPRLHEKIRPYFLRRTKTGVLKFLPPMAQIILPVTMTVLQEKLSKSIMAKNPQLIQAMFANSKMSKKERGSLNNILMQLRKCLCHPFVYSDAIEERHHDPAALHRNLVEASSKLILLELMLPKLKERGHRVLIFSQFLQQLDIVEDFLNGLDYGYRRLDGTISSLEKQRRIDAYNEPGSKLFAFLLSTRAGGVGINLATADTVIIMDPDFNPHQDIQALSRAHRIGQKNKVLCFQLVTKDSVEERIMQAGRKKMALDHALIESMDDDELAGDDLESILKHGAQALFSEDYQKTAIHYDSASVDKLLDRSQIEQTATNEEGSAEAQFNHARVWANEKSGFEENEVPGEEEAPVLLNSSVWDQIIAHREEEARREAEANREVLGRGARRRMAINYKTNMLENMPLPEDIGPESSESSDDFAGGAESPDDTDDEAALAAKGKRVKITPVQLMTPAATPTSRVQNSKVNNKPQQSKKAISTQRKQKSRNHVMASSTPENLPPNLQPLAEEADPPRTQLPSPNQTPRKSTTGQTTTRGKPNRRT